MPKTNGRVHNSSIWPGGIDPILMANISSMIQNAGNPTTSRQGFFAQFQDPRRSIDDECGYPDPNSTTVGTADQYRALYDREPIATRVCQVMPKESWQATPEIQEDEDPTVSTPFEEGWQELEVNLAGGQTWHNDEQGGSIWEMLLRADILSGIGHFGVILLGIDDGRNLQEPVAGVVAVPEGYNPQGSISQVGGGQAPPYGAFISGTDVQYSVPQAGNPQTPGAVPSMPNRGPNPQRNERMTAKDLIANGAWRGGGRWHRDCYMTESEEDWLRALPNLTANESKIIDRWRHARNSLTQNADPYFMSGDQVGGAFGAYGSAGWAQSPASLSGTDQQYFGVQFGPSEQMGPPAPGKRRLLFMRCFDESLVQIVRYEWNIRNPRFGMPVMYRVTLNDPREQHSGVGLPLATVFVHWSRIIHLADNRGSSQIFGVPRLRPVLNRIMDLQKLYGASAEGYWRACFTGYSFETHPNLGGDVLINRGDMRNQFENYMNGLQRYLMSTGGSVKTLAPTVVDPTPHIEAALTAICIMMAIPKRIFMGSAPGQLGGKGDAEQADDNFNDVLRTRHHLYLTPMVICPLIDRLIQIGVLPAPKDPKGAAKRAVQNALRRGREVRRQGRNILIYNADGKPTAIQTAVGYKIDWPDLDALSAQDKAAVALQTTQAMAAYVSGGVENLMPPHEYYVNVLGYDEEDADELVDSAEQHQEEQMDEQQQQMSEQGFEPAPPPGYQDPDNPTPTTLDAGQSLHNPTTGKQLGANPHPPAAAPAPGFGAGPPGGAGKPPPFGGKNQPPKPGGGFKPGGAKPPGGLK